MTMHTQAEVSPSLVTLFTDRYWAAGEVSTEKVESLRGLLCRGINVCVPRQITADVDTKILGRFDSG